MQRLARYLFTLCSAASVVMGVAVCVLWARSHLRSDHLFWYVEENADGQPTRVVSLYSGAGAVQWASTRSTYWNRLPGMVRVEPIGRPSYVSKTDPDPPLPKPHPGPGKVTYSIDALAVGAYRRAATEALSVRHMIMMGRTGPLATRTWTMNAVLVRYWFLALLAAALPAAWLRRRGQARRRGRGECARCGYDLRATPGHCPECGAIPTAGSELEQPPSNSILRSLA